MNEVSPWVQVGKLALGVVSPFVLSALLLFSGGQAPDEQSAFVIFLAVVLFIAGLGVATVAFAIARGDDQRVYIDADERERMGDALDHLIDIDRLDSGFSIEMPNTIVAVDNTEGMEAEGRRGNALLQQAKAQLGAVQSLFPGLFPTDSVHLPAQGNVFHIDTRRSQAHIGGCVYALVKLNQESRAGFAGLHRHGLRLHIERPLYDAICDYISHHQDDPMHQEARFIIDSLALVSDVATTAQGRG